jgi:hypothetical protein
MYSVGIDKPIRNSVMAGRCSPKNNTMRGPRMAERIKLNKTMEEIYPCLKI